mgnify:CR=1 FL=1
MSASARPSPDLGGAPAVTSGVRRGQSYALVLADSVAPNGARLTTLDVTFPMFVQPQLLRHRAFSFSVQSTRAVPLETQIARVRESAVGPSRWGAAQRGMVAAEEVSETTARHALANWEAAAVEAANYAHRLLSLGVHQEVAGRLLAPFATCRAIVSATEWDNFFALRISGEAQAEIRELAEAIRDAREASVPAPLSLGQWHLPMVDAEDVAWALADSAGDADVALRLVRLVSAGRCARVSFLQHDGRRGTPRDAKLGARLAADGHWSALEHQATPHVARLASGNFRGWQQFRKMHLHEDNRAAWGAK